MAVAKQVRSIGITLLGIILAFIPPALWVAWTEAILLAVALVGVLTAVLLVLLVESSSVEDGQPVRGTDAREVLTDQSVAEIHRIFPLTYHHSLVEKVRFHRAMEKVRYLMRGAGESQRDN
jgi:hypothetical protein